VWAKIMAQASEGLPIVPFTEPTKAVQSGEQVTIPKVSGMTQARAIEALKAVGLTGYVQGQVASGVRRGLVVGTNPRGRAIKGSSVGLLLSSGSPPAPKPAPVPAEPAPEPSPPPSTTATGPTNPGNGNGRGRGNGPKPPPNRSPSIG
jgi:beta-lactam-binding protein with PASTA domain